MYGHGHILSTSLDLEEGASSEAKLFDVSGI